MVLEGLRGQLFGLPVVLPIECFGGLSGGNKGRIIPWRPGNSRSAAQE